MSAELKNGEQKSADDSQDIAAAVVAAAVPIAASPPTVDSIVLKVIIAIVLLGGAFGGTAYAIDDRNEKRFEKRLKLHSEHPHKGAATEKDVKRLELKVERVIVLLGGVP